MAASASDKARKSYSYLQKTLSSGISDVASSLTPNNTTNIPTDTGVSFVVDRVDSNGNKTPTLRELMTGVVSGSTLANLVRGQQGTTAQAHLANAVIEFVNSGQMWNDLIDFLLQDHSNPNGNHKTLTDDNGNEWLERGSVASAVNQVKISNSATGNPVKVEANGDDSNINLLFNGKGSGLVIPKGAYPQGMLINGKITTSVASNNLTVAIKTVDGNDPSSTNPVYVRIGNTVRAITGALSVTLNAGTSWFGKGASIFATAESDYFVYLVWNTNTSAVQIAFSSDPNMRVYSDFSTTSTNWNYFGGSGTAPASTDEAENVGRFNAILGATASFNWSLPATSIIINRPIFETRVFSFTNAGSAGGTFYYQQRGPRKEVWGTTNSISLSASAQATGVVTWPAGFFLVAPTAVVAGTPSGTVKIVAAINAAPSTTNVTVAVETGDASSVTGSSLVHLHASSSG